VKVAVEYNVRAKATDAKDARQEAYTAVRKRINKWTTTLWMWVLDSAALNAYYLATKFNSQGVKTGRGEGADRVVDRRAFILRIVEKVVSYTKLALPEKVWAQTRAAIPPSQLHKAQCLPVVGGQGDDRRPCARCSAKTTWKCERCNKWYCLVPDRNCFYDAHKEC
jgi:hypothetical protein